MWKVVTNKYKWGMQKASIIFKFYLGLVDMNDEVHEELIMRYDS